MAPNPPAPSRGQNSAYRLSSVGFSAQPDIPFQITGSITSILTFPVALGERSYTPLVATGDCHISLLHLQTGTCGTASPLSRTGEA